MKYIYAALLLHSAGKEVTEANMKKVIKAVGDKSDPAQIKSLAAALSEINVDEVLSSAVMTPVAAPSVAAQPPPAEEKKEEKKEEEKEAEEEAFEGLGSLFG